MRRQTKKKNEDGWDTSSFGVLQRLKEEMEEQDRAARARQKATVPDRPALKSDEELFREAMGGVREIPEFTAIPFPQRQPNPEPCRRSMDDDVAILRQIVRGERKIRLSDTGEYIEWNSPLLAGDLADRLHRGEFSVQDCIDLHGMYLDAAENALTRFFKDARRKKLFCVKVIHGRGLRSPQGPVLKEAFVDLLQGTLRKWVLAYATAKDCDGGLGATYVILQTK